MFANTDTSRQRLIIGVCCLSVLVVGTDATIVNVALPSIERALHASVSGLQWIVDAYTLALASLLMFSGSAADRFGRRRVFQSGMVLFTLGSLLCSIAPTLDTLIAFRVMQAVGGSALNPVALSIIAHAIPDRRARARAMGVWGSVAGLGLALGPVVGGFLVDAIGWRSVFWVNVPLGIAAILLTQRVVTESRAATPRRFDPPGQVLMALLIASLTAAIIEGQRQGWTSPLILGLIAIAAGSAMGFILVEQRVKEPLLELRFFRSAPFSGAMIIAVCAFGALGGFLFLNTLYLQGVRHDSASHAGLVVLPMALMMALFAQLSGRLVASRGPRLPLLVAGLTMTVGAGLMIGLTTMTSTAYLLVAFVIFGIALGMVNAPISNTAVSGMPPDQTGVAASVASTCRQVGSALGVAISGAFVAGASTHSFAHASHGAWAVECGCGVVVLICGVTCTSRWARSTTARAGLNRETPADDQAGVRAAA